MGCSGTRNITMDGNAFTTLTKAYISAGSNLGDRKANLEFAVHALEKAGTVRQVSSYFETEPVGYTDQPWFLNLAIELETRLEKGVLPSRSPFGNAANPAAE